MVNSLLKKPGRVGVALYIIALIFLSIQLLQFAAADDCYRNSASGANPVPLCSCMDINFTRGNLSGKFQLQNAIDCSATSTWNDYAGFTPIGTDGARFTGTFNGQGFNISNLHINLTSTDFVGLFGAVDSGGIILNTGLVNVNITGHDYVGALAGLIVYGTINNSLAAGGNVTGNIRVGGLVGDSYANISNSYSLSAPQYLNITKYN
ncbi:MAG TPA: hypothetical protein VJI32_04980 [Candidatus Nanoarchaeia archaeon]|nr:hypothetical protein [Candidatus Nanoarchaeia archaeon]